MMPEDSDQLTDDELWTSIGDSLDVLQDLPAALESLQTEISNVIQEMSAAAISAFTWAAYDRVPSGGILESLKRGEARTDECASVCISIKRTDGTFHNL